MSQETVWLGVAVLGLNASNAKRTDGFQGAFAPVACLSKDVVEAIRMVADEFSENGYELLGFESFMPAHMYERELTSYEADLVELTTSYPVQFKDVHLHKGDA